MYSLPHTITKRNGKPEAFSLEKIKNAILKAAAATGTSLSATQMEGLLRRLLFTDNMSVEEIQNQVEMALMAEGLFATAKAFIVYRNQHTEDRQTLQKLRFLVDYCNAANAATGSKFDANANVENKNLATLIGELPKGDFIRLNRRLLCDRLKEMYGKEAADRYLDLLNHHFIYKNDETSLANYCASITMYPWLLNGTKSIGGNSSAPTNLKSFCGGFINMVFIVSSMLSGACATVEFLMYMSHFLEKEYGEDYYLHADDVVDLSKRQRTLDKVITDCFEQIVYSINQPTGARNFQSVFWNISYYDRPYFESLFGEFIFPDGSRPHWEPLSWLQKRFMNWFNAERTKTVLTFPVETMALLCKDGDVIDKEYGDFTAEMYAKGHSFFTYMSDNADSLASCCRLRNEIQDNGFSYSLGAGGGSGFFTSFSGGAAGGPAGGCRRGHVVAALHDRVVVEHAARGRARTHGDDPLGFGHRVVDAADDGGHLVRDTARHDHHVGVTRRGAEDLEAEARHVETGGAGSHHLDGAARQTHGDGPLAVLACEPEDLFDAGQRDARGQGFFKSHLSILYFSFSSPGRHVAIRRRRGRRG